MKLHTNPFHQRSEVRQILGNIPFKDLYDKGLESETYYFRTYTNFQVSGAPKILHPGKYVLKIYKPKYKLKSFYENYLLTLSNLKLIPKIHIINRDFIIMDYFDGLRLETIIECRLISRKDFDVVLENIKKMITKYKSLGHKHNDLHFGNILVNKNLDVVFIDPRLLEFGDENISKVMNEFVELADRYLE